MKIAIKPKTWEIGFNAFYNLNERIQIVCFLTALATRGKTVRKKVKKKHDRKECGMGKKKKK